MSLFELAFNTGVRRRPEGIQGTITKVWAAGTTAWTVYAAGFSMIDVLGLTIIFLSSMMVLAFLVIGPMSTSRADTIPLYDWVLAALSIVVGAYFVWHVEEIAQRITLLFPLTFWDMAFSSLIVLLALESMRRTVGSGLTVIVIVFIIYNLFGDNFSGPLSHGEIGLNHFLDMTVFTTDGLFGAPLRVAATYAFIFVFFGTALAKTGGADFFFNLAASISGKATGGPAKIAVISSGLYGTISGSPTSDVVTTGSITIPMMKRMGYKPAMAGAVEVAASTGGSLLPPVMGSAAFIMAEYTGVPYVDIAIAGLIPALLYYVPIYTQVHLRAKRLGIKGLGTDQIKSVWATLKEGGLFIIPLIVITWALLEGYTPTFSGLFGALAVGIVSSLKRSTRLNPAALFDILSQTSMRMVAVAGACAAAGLVIGGITMTGLASKFSALVFLISGSSIFISLIVAALLTILLGLGMPTPSAYILAAVLVAPVMADLRIDLMAGHLFLLYFAVMSALTPPVAVAAYAASAIAEENPLKIAGMAVRLALGAFLVPFSFVYNKGLLMMGSTFDIALATTSVGIGLVLVAVAIEGFMKTPLNRLARGAFALAGILLLFVDPILMAVAAGLTVLGLFSSGMMTKAAKDTV